MVSMGPAISMIPTAPTLAKNTCWKYVLVGWYKKRVYMTTVAPHPPLPDLTPRIKRPSRPSRLVLLHHSAIITSAAQQPRGPRSPQGEREGDLEEGTILEAGWMEAGTKFSSWFSRIFSRFSRFSCRFCVQLVLLPFSLFWCFIAWFLSLGEVC